jgi:hypothetical protein
MKILGAVSLIIAVLGYKLMVRVGNTLRSDPMANASYDKGSSGCSMSTLALVMMLGGAGMFIYACIEYTKNYYYRRDCTADCQRECRRAAAAEFARAGGMFSLEVPEALSFLICSRLFTDDEHAAIESAGRV